jgi:flagellar protein FliJ
MSRRFRLETLLKLREFTRDERRRDLAQAYEAERILHQRIAALHEEVTAVQQRTRRLATGTLNMEDLLHARRYQLLTQSHIASSNQQLEQVRQEVERRRQALMEADREVKVLEKLRERSQRQEEQAAARREAKQLDEAGLRTFQAHQETPR